MRRPTACSPRRRPGSRSRSNRVAARPRLRGGCAPAEGDQYDQPEHELYVDSPVQPQRLGRSYQQEGRQVPREDDGREQEQHVPQATAPSPGDFASGESARCAYHVVAARGDGLAAAESVQVLGQRLRRGVAVAGLLLQALQADRLQVRAILGFSSRGGTGSSERTCSSVSGTVAARNGGRPVSTRRGWRPGRRRRRPGRSPGSGPGPARGPCSWACQDLAGVGLAAPTVEPLGQAEVGDLGRPVGATAARSRASGRDGRCRAGGRRASPGPASRPARRPARSAAACRPAAGRGCRPRPAPGRRRAGRRARRPRGSGRCWDGAAGRRPRPRCGSGRSSAARACRPARIIFRATRRFEAHLPGLVDDAHAAAAELLQDLVVAELGRAGGRDRGRRGAGDDRDGRGLGRGGRSCAPETRRTCSGVVSPPGDRPTSRRRRGSIVRAREPLP